MIDQLREKKRCSLCMRTSRRRLAMVRRSIYETYAVGGNMNTVNVRNIVIEWGFLKICADVGNKGRVSQK